jgi:hypothetical protein
MTTKSLTTEQVYKNIKMPMAAENCDWMIAGSVGNNGETFFSEFPGFHHQSASPPKVDNEIESQDKSDRTRIMGFTPGIIGVASVELGLQ